MERLDEMQRKHFDDIKAKHAWRITFQNDRLVGLWQGGQTDRQTYLCGKISHSDTCVILEKYNIFFLGRQRRLRCVCF